MSLTAVFIVGVIGGIVASMLIDVICMNRHSKDDDL
jgi:hypothetical protein